MGKKVLIVDDTAFMRILMRNIVEKNGYEVAGEAANGKEAIDKYLELKPDLVTMDITMPEMDGLEALQEIKKLDTDAKIIMCTAIDEEERMIKAIELGALEYFIKPFDEERISLMMKMIFDMY